MRYMVFLFVFIFSPVMSITTGSHGSLKTDKLMELRTDMKPVAPKTVEDSIKEVFSNWQVASASFYDSKDSTQTREDADGVGAFGRTIKSGSIALGSSFAEIFRDNDLSVYIQIKDFNIVTPYGKGIFRVDDIMASKHNRKGKFRIDFNQDDLNTHYKRKGRFKVKFRILKIETVGE